MKKLLFLLLSVLILIPFSCQDKADSEASKDDSMHFEARKYFSAFTQGMIKPEDDIVFRTLKKQTADSALLRAGVSVSPEFEFDIYIDSVRGDVVIDPIDPLQRGETYSISIDLNQWFSGRNHQNLEVEVTVFQQHLDVSRKGLLLKDNQRFVEVDVFTSLPESPKAIKSLFTYPAKKINLTKVNDLHYLVRLQVNDNKTEHIPWSGEDLKSQESGEITVYQFDPDVFEVVNTHYNRNNKHFKVYFSQGIDQEQDKTGLITLGQEAATFDIQDNVLTVYITSKSREDQTLSIDHGLQSETGIKLQSALSYEIEIELVKPAVQWLSDGNYLPRSGNLKLPIKAKGLKSIHVQVVEIKSENAARFVSWNQLSNVDLHEIRRYGRLKLSRDFQLTTNDSQAEQWAEYGLDMTDLFERKNGMVYTIMLSYEPANTILECVDSDIIDEETKQVTHSFFDKVESGYYQNNYYDRYRYYGQGYEYKERNNPCHISYYMERSAIIKNIQCTNVFPIIKGAKDDWIVAVKDLTQESLTSNAKVELLNLQGMPITSGSTSSKGVVRFSNLNQTPTALKISHDGVTSHYNIDPGSALSLTEFDVSSEVKDIDNRIFAYTERDIWRPGDSIYLDVMLNHAKFDFEEGLPITVRFFNPKGVQHSKIVQTVTENAIYSFPLSTGLDAPTGFWKAEIQVGPHKKQKSIRVETIRPNVVDIQFEFERTRDDWIYDDQFRGKVAVDYLAGYPLKGGDVNLSSNMRAIASPFSNFKNYRFLPYKKNHSRQNQEFLKVTTDEKGRASFDEDRSFKSMDGVFRLLLDCKIDLPGGGLNTMTRTFMVSPFESYVGIQKASGRGWRGSFNYDEKPGINLVHLDQKGDFKKGTTEAKVYVYKFSKDWWYDRYRLTRGHNYHSGIKRELVHEAKVEFVDGKYAFTHDKEKWGSGSFKIVLKDPESNHRAEYKYHNVSSRSYASQVNPQVLELQTDTNTYTTGQTMKVTLPAIPMAKALISIETGDRVHDIFWADLDREPLELKVKREWTPNVYLSVHVVQNYGQTHNDRPMRMYGVKKIKINTLEGDLYPVIKGPEKARPNATLKLQVSERENRPMEYTIALVDQGLLNMTGFSTPDPRAHFNKLMALRVKTWDIFEKLIQYMNPSFAGILSIGGDEALNKLLDESADFNRFEPVVFHKGPFKIQAGGSKEHSFEIPNYIGKVKAVVVAVGQDRYGHADKDVRIASPLMIQSQLPRALNVSDKVIAPITLFRDEDEVKTVQLNLKSENDKVEFESSSISATFESGDQLTTQVPITVKDKAGTAQLNFHASSGKHESTEETKIFVNYPNAYSSESEYLEIDPGDTRTLDIECFGFRETQHFDLVVSGSMMPDFVSYYENLLKYPHGCVEQLTSKGYALMYIDKIVQLSPTEREKAIDHLDAAILKIQSYQNSSGTFDYWPGGYYNVWGDLYAGLFLHEAQSESRTVSEEAVRRWVNHNIAKANAWRIEGTMTNRHWIRREENVQAYRLYALARAGHAQKGAMNRFQSRNGLTTLAKAYLAGAYGHAGFPDVGRDLMKSALNSVGENGSYYYWGSSMRNRAVIITIGSELFPDLITRRFYRHWVEDVNQKRRVSTQEKGQAFRACYRYLGEGNAIAEEVDFEVQSDKYNRRHKLNAMESKRFAWQGEEVDGQVKVINHGKSRLFLRRIERAITTDLYEPAQSSNLSLNVTYHTPYGSIDEAKGVEQGDEIIIRVTVRNQSNVNLDYMALTVKSPSGWELLNPRILKTADVQSNAYNNFNFQDFRDDKVYTYFKLNKNAPGSSRVFSFRARAQLLGDYYLPSVRAADMYDLDVFATTAAKRVTVK
jgi:uncharacterized protein YfaS (alpha-2-macroglobulin family)